MYTHNYMECPQKAFRYTHYRALDEMDWSWYISHFCSLDFQSASLVKKEYSETYSSTILSFLKWPFFLNFIRPFIIYFYFSNYKFGLNMFILSHHNYHLLSLQLPKAENKVARPLHKDQMAIAMMNWESTMKI